MAIAAHDIVSTSPTNTFATLANKLQHDATSSAVSDGNLKYTEPSNTLAHSAMSNAIANFSATSGKKWYWEVVIFNNTDTNERIASSIGVILQQNDTQGNVMYSTDYFNGTCYAWGNDTNNTNNTSATAVYQRNGSTLNSVSSAQESYLKHGVVIGVFLDLESSPNTVTLYANGSELSDRGGVTTKMNLAASTQFFPLFGCGTGSGTQIHTVNFGADSSFGGNKTGSANATDAKGIGDFYYSPPTGALALCTANIQSSLAIDPAVDDVPEDYFKCVTYPGTGSANNINVGFTPDLVWIKCKDHTFDHMIFDSIRGVNKNIYSNGTSQEVTTNNSLTEFITTGNKGFKVVSDNGVNNSSYNYISWNWEAGGAPTADNTVAASTGNAMTANSVSVDGSLQSSYTPSGSPTIYPKRMSIGVKQGFSIVKYYGNNATNSNQSIPSGLSSLDFVIIKDLDDSEYWFVYHKDLSTNHNVYLNLTNAQTNVSSSGGGGIKNPLTDGNIVPLLGNVNTTNINDTHNFIAYCWHSVEGYSKFG